MQPAETRSFRVETREEAPGEWTVWANGGAIGGVVNDGPGDYTPHLLWVDGQPMNRKLDVCYTLEEAVAEIVIRWQEELAWERRGFRPQLSLEDLMADEGKGL